MTEAEKYLKEVLCYDEEDYFCSIDVPEAMQSYADEQVKKDLSRFLRWLDKRYGTPNPNPQLYDLDIKNFLNEKP